MQFGISYVIPTPSSYSVAPGNHNHSSYTATLVLVTLLYVALWHNNVCVVISGRTRVNAKHAKMLVCASVAYSMDYIAMQTPI